MLRAMMDNSGGRDVLAHALTAGAGAVVALLIGQREGMTESAKGASRKGVKAVSTAGGALRAAFSAAMQVVHVHGVVVDLFKAAKKRSQNIG